MISVLVPTRGRPNSLLRMLDSVFALASQPERVEVVICVDDDDDETLAVDVSAYNVRRIVGPRRGMGILNATCFSHSTGSIIILGNDDVVMRTQGWDDAIRRAVGDYCDGVYLLYPNDLYKAEKLCTFPILSRLTCDTIGDPFPAEYRGAFIDAHLMDIFKQLEGIGHSRIAYLPHVVFEHMHFRAGKSEPDQTYLARDRFGDDHSFLFLAAARNWAANRLAAIVDGTDPDLVERLHKSRPAGGWFLRLAHDVVVTSQAPLHWRARLFAKMCVRLVYNFCAQKIRKLRRK